MGQAFAQARTSAVAKCAFTVWHEPGVTFAAGTGRMYKTDSSLSCVGIVSRAYVWFFRAAKVDDVDSMNGKMYFTCILPLKMF